jgi:2-polyprenyl-3-methyl-5-hydroxy-6-metoxy-1,4-benzoquinol methylase
VNARMDAQVQATADPWPGGLEAVRTCPSCGDLRNTAELSDLRDNTFGTAKGAWSLKRCVGCRAVYLDPRPDPASIHLAYRNYYTHAAAKSSTRNIAAFFKHALANGYRNRLFGTRLKPALAAGAVLTPLFPALAQHIKEEDRGIGRAEGAARRLLDLGCGNGHFLKTARRLGWMSYGVDTDASAAEAARDCGEIIGSEVNGLGADYERFFDVVTLSHVIEHVPDPVATLRHCRRVLKPGGYVWIETPNIGSAGYEFFGASWRGLEAPRHLVLFNPASLRICLERAGFERIRILPPRDVTERLFILSAVMREGRIAEATPGSLSTQLLQQMRREATRAREMVRSDPGRSEFVGAVAFRSENPPSAVPSERAAR